MTQNDLIPEPTPLTYTPEVGPDYLQHTEFVRSPTHRNRLAGIVRAVEDAGIQPPGSHILEIGCGRGNISAPLASLGHQVMAVDIHRATVDAARDRYPLANLQFETRSALEMDLSVYDLIICTEVLEHVPHYKEMIEAISKGMKPGAALILTIPNGYCASEILCRPSYALKRHAWSRWIVKLLRSMASNTDLTTDNHEDPHVNFFTLARLGALFTENGLNVDRFYRSFHFWVLWETFFSAIRRPERTTRKDFEKSQSLSPRRCACWAFLLTKA